VPCPAAQASHGHLSVLGASNARERSERIDPNEREERGRYAQPCSWNQNCNRGGKVAGSAGAAVRHATELGLAAAVSLCLV
jgi:hypothetical protein